MGLAAGWWSAAAKPHECNIVAEHCDRKLTRSQILSRLKFIRFVATHASIPLRFVQLALLDSIMARTRSARVAISAAVRKGSCAVRSRVTCGKLDSIHETVRRFEQVRMS